MVKPCSWKITDMPICLQATDACCGAAHRSTTLFGSVWWPQAVKKTAFSHWEDRGVLFFVAPESPESVIRLSSCNKLSAGLPIGGATIIQYAALFDMAGFAHGLPQREHPPKREAWEPLLCQFILLDLKQPLGATRVRTVQGRVGMPRTIPCLELQLHALFFCELSDLSESCVMLYPYTIIIHHLPMCTAVYVNFAWLHPLPSPGWWSQPTSSSDNLSWALKVGALGSSSELS